MNDFVVKIFDTDSARIEVSVIPSGYIIAEKLSPTPANEFWTQAVFRNNENGHVICGLPVTDKDGKIKTFETEGEALQGAIDFFGI